MSETNLEATRFAPGRCQECGNMRQTRNVTFRRNAGMLLAHRIYKVNGNLCRACIHRRFWEFTGKNIALGPWGTISLIVTPLFLIQNTGVVRCGAV